MPTLNIEQDHSAEINLQNSTSISFFSDPMNASVHVDYKLDGHYTSAIKANSGISNPFTVEKEKGFVIMRTQLESSLVRVGVRKSKVKVIY